MVATYLHIIKRVSVGSFELPQIVANVAVFLLNETDDELEDFHGLPLSMRNGHSIDGAASPGTGSDLNEGMNAANICVKIYTWTVLRWSGLGRDERKNYRPREFI